MFTGIVTAVGTAGQVEELPDAKRIRIDTSPDFTDDLRPGDSIAVDGVCLTVLDHDDEGFAVQAIGTTLSRTTLAQLAPGRPLNLEKALALGERLGGHLVQGHVDGVGRVLSVVHTGAHVLVDLELPEEVAEVTVLHGSIAVDGVSLTVNSVAGARRAQVALIPYTWEHTTLRRLEPGSTVNLEGDMVGRFVVHYLNRRGGAA